MPLTYAVVLLMVLWCSSSSPCHRVVDLSDPLRNPFGQ